MEMGGESKLGVMIWLSASGGMLSVVINYDVTPGYTSYH